MSVRESGPGGIPGRSHPSFAQWRRRPLLRLLPPQLLRLLPLLRLLLPHELPDERDGVEYDGVLLLREGAEYDGVPLELVDGFEAVAPGLFIRLRTRSLKLAAGAAGAALEAVAVTGVEATPGLFMRPRTRSLKLGFAAVAGAALEVVAVVGVAATPGLFIRPRTRSLKPGFVGAAAGAVVERYVLVGYVW